MKAINTVGCFVKKNAILVIAFVAALITAFIIHPDKEYLNYFDYRTLTCLFCVLAVVCALKNIRFFTILARKVIELTGNLRIATLALVYITFIGSMLIANDMALLTFLPLGYFVLTETKQEKYMAVVFVLQNIAANLGGMLTPFGNPQNLYLYSFFSIPTGEFTLIMLPSFLLAIFLITICCLCLPKEKFVINNKCEETLPPIRTILYLILFAISIIIVFRIVPYWIGLCIIPIALLILDYKALKKVDYPLLLTFVCFFIFSSNMSRIEGVRNFFESLLSKSTLLVSILSCQVISNVPSAILLSQFTENYRDLLLGVNIGGTGTLIASLASLITFRTYCAHNPGKTKHYLFVFGLFNLCFLVVMTLFAMFFPY